VQIFAALMWLAVIVTFGVLIYTDIGGEQTAAVTAYASGRRAQNDS
jgi:hypothetical protein